MGSDGQLTQTAAGPIFWAGRVPGEGSACQ
jgi:hypothetical protein